MPSTQQLYQLQQFDSQIDASNKRLNEIASNLVETEAVSIYASGDTKLKITPRELLIKSAISVDKADCNMDALTFAPKILEYEEVGADSEPEHEKEKKKAKRSTDIDINIDINKNLNVHSQIISSLWDGTAHYTMQNGKQNLTGEVEIRKGRLNLLGTEFILDGGKVILTGTWPPNPALDIDAETERYGVEATLTLRGVMNDPQFELTSNPPMHTDEIISYLLFGESLSDISTLRVMQLATQIYLLKNPSKALGITDRAQNMLSVDYIDFRDDGENSEIAIGKQLNERMLAEIRKPIESKNGGAAVDIEYELHKNISVETSIGNENDSHIGINWKMDY